MKLDWSKLSSLLRRLAREDGQDLVEYALLVALLSLGATAGMRSYATKIGQVFTSIGTTFSSTV